MCAPITAIRFSQNKESVIGFGVLQPYMGDIAGDNRVMGYWISGEPALFHDKVDGRFTSPIAHPR
jgi:hypothetical protein